MSENRLTILSTFKNEKEPTKAICLCSCGKEVIKILTQVTTNGVKSCGCLKIEKLKLNGGKNKTHGHCSNRTRTYRTWEGMKRRCCTDKDRGSIDYKGRGIKICDRWMEFKNFLEDMGERPENKTLDRKDNDGGYCKENCRWADAQQQARNKRSNALVEYNGNKITIAELSEITGLRFGLLWDRIFTQKYSVYDAVNKRIETKEDKTKRLQDLKDPITGLFKKKINL